MEAKPYVRKHPNGIVFREHNKRTVVAKTDLGLTIELARIFPDNGDSFGAFIKRGKLQVVLLNLTRESAIELREMIKVVIDIDNP